MKRISIKKRIYKPSFWQKLKFWKIYQDFEIEVPERWDEVKPKDFLALFAASLQKDDGLRAMNCIHSILPSSIKDEVHLLKSSSLYRVYSFMAFCEPRKVAENGGWIWEDYKLLTNPVLKEFLIRVGNTLIHESIVLALPNEDLKDISAENFRDAVTAYSKIQGGEKEYFWKVIQAVFDTDIDANVLSKHLTYPVPTLVVRYYGDCLEKLHRDIFDISPTFFGVEGSGEENGNSINFGWDGVFLEIAKDGVFGTYEQVLKSKFHDVMVYSIKKYEDALAQQKALEKQQNV